MKKNKVIFLLILIVIAASLFVGVRLLFQKRVQPIERSEELNQPISELLRNKEEIECFIFNKEPVSRLRAKNGKARIDGFRNELNENEDSDGSTLFNDSSSTIIWKFKEGTRYNSGEIVDLLQQGSDEAKKIQGAISIENWIKKIETDKIKYTCKKASIPDEYFQIPDEIKITEYKPQEKEKIQSSPFPKPKDEIIEDPEMR